MTTGALIFAFNNEAVDYVSMARWCSQRVRRHLGIPVALVTDQALPDQDPDFDKIITVNSPGDDNSRYFSDFGKTVSWHNGARADAYNLSPWDTTLLLDADYVVGDSTLLTVINGSVDFACHRLAYDMTTGQYLDGLNCFGEYQLPMWWATVIVFKKTTHSRFIFESMQMVRNNWQHYRDLYGIRNSTYRNDFALSIAIGIVSGHTNKVTEIPWDLATVMPEVTVSKLDLDNDSYIMQYNNHNGKLMQIMIRGMNFHAMGKKTLGEIIEADSRAGLLDSGH